MFENGKKEVVFHNGVKRENFPDGYFMIHFTNNDIKQVTNNIIIELNKLIMYNRSYQMEQLFITLLMQIQLKHH